MGVQLLTHLHADGRLSAVTIYPGPPCHTGQHKFAAEFSNSRCIFCVRTRAELEEDDPPPAKKDEALWDAIKAFS